MLLSSTEQETLSTIKRVSDEHSYLLCPHSAIGVCALETKLYVFPKILLIAYIKVYKPLFLHRGELMASSTSPLSLVSMATASPAKFPEAQQLALSFVAPLPSELEKLSSLPTRCQTISVDAKQLKDIIDGEGQNIGVNALTGKFQIKVPGSCANLGSGFDVFGLAVGLYLTAVITVTERKVQVNLWLT